MSIDLRPRLIFTYPPDVYEALKGKLKPQEIFSNSEVGSENFVTSCLITFVKGDGGVP